MKKYFISIYTNFSTLLLILLTTAVLSQVFYRYVLKLSVGGFGELPAIFMLLSIWMSAAVNFERDTHISLKVTDLYLKNKKHNRCIKLFTRIILLITILIFTVLYWRYLIYIINSKDITPGLMLPQWWFVFLIFISILFMLFSSFKHFIEAIRIFTKSKGDM